jgi:hypothetical protein
VSQFTLHLLISNDNSIFLNFDHKRVMDTEGGFDFFGGGLISLFFLKEMLKAKTFLKIKSEIGHLNDRLFQSTKQKREIAIPAYIHRFLNQ